MKKRTALLCVLSALAAMATQFPLVWAAKVLPKTLPDTIRYSGTISRGSAVEPAWFGTANFKTHVLKGAMDFDYAGQGYSGSGVVTRKALRDFKSKGRIAALSQFDGRLTNLGGAYTVSISELKFGVSGTACTEAQGVMSTDVLAANAAYWQWSGPQLSGPISCEEGAIVARVSGQGQSQGVMVSVQGDIHIKADMTYSIDIIVQTPDLRAGAILPLYGFDDSGNGRYHLIETGRVQS